MGLYALHSNAGNFNTASGLEALYSNTSGVFNTASGVQPLYSNTTGNYNTASGRRALYNNTTGSYNTAIGEEADVSAGNLENATAIGYMAEVDASNKIQLGNDQVSSVATVGKLTTGAVTYPNEDGQAGQVLTTDGNGVASWTGPAGPSGDWVTSNSAIVDCPAGKQAISGGCLASYGGSIRWNAPYGQDMEGNYSGWRCEAGSGSISESYVFCQ